MLNLGLCFFSFVFAMRSIALLLAAGVALAQLTPSDVNLGSCECPAQTVGGGCVSGDYMDRMLPCNAPANAFPAACPTQPSSARIAVLHVPKAAGMSFNEMFLTSNASLNFTLLHDRATEFIPEDYDIFIVLTRDPIGRVVSAFNFNDPFYSSPSRDRDFQCGGITLAADPPACRATARFLYLDCFPPPMWADDANASSAVDAFARSFEDDGACGNVSRTCTRSAWAVETRLCGSNPHLAMGVEWFVSQPHGGQQTVLERVRRGLARAFIVRTEAFEDDMDALWEWLCVPTHLRPPIARTNDQSGNSNGGSTDSSHDKFSDMLPPGDIFNMDLRSNDTVLSAAGRDAMARALEPEQRAIDELEALAENGRAVQRQWGATTHVRGARGGGGGGGSPLVPAS